MKHIKSKIKAVIFDMDGTIIDSEGIWKQVMLDSIEQEGIELTNTNIEILKTCFGANLYTVTEKIKREFKLKTPIEALITKKIALAEQYFKNAGESEIQFINGFKKFHNLLIQNSISTSIATNSGITVLQYISTNLKLNDIFGQNIYSAEHVGNKTKPDPAVFLHAANKLNARPDECIIFEDSGAGFMAANAAGIKCIAIKNETFKNDLKFADYVIDNYDEAVEAIKKII